MHHFVPAACGVRVGLRCGQEDRPTSPGSSRRPAAPSSSRRSVQRAAVGQETGGSPAREGEAFGSPTDGPAFTDDELSQLESPDGGQGGVAMGHEDLRVACVGSPSAAPHCRRKSSLRSDWASPGVSPTSMVRTTRSLAEWVYQRGPASRHHQQPDGPHLRRRRSATEAASSSLNRRPRRDAPRTRSSLVTAQEKRQGEVTASTSCGAARRRSSRESCCR
ncbi:hypothetical protein BJ968_004770 [Kineococcus aurantiacus]|uniref:Uncharacterized protein n=1 Tax=Kineococcus aurantiacus TaxID=37633 RepID=A0A7Y9J3B8_9ACTN|nr:hypothetical protein [Kineococcus aurantiacus]